MPQTKPSKTDKLAMALSLDQDAMWEQVKGLQASMFDRDNTIAIMKDQIAGLRQSVAGWHADGLVLKGRIEICHDRIEEHERADAQAQMRKLDKWHPLCWLGLHKRSKSRPGICLRCGKRRVIGDPAYGGMDTWV